MKWDKCSTDGFPREPGLYAIYLKDGASLAVGDTLLSGLLYIGKAKNLASRQVRQHFATGKTGSSTLRRTLGALLKVKLNLTATHRGNRATKENCQHYEFANCGESRLTDWMMSNLQVSIFPMPQEVLADEEKEAIAAYQPPLCLEHWHNPLRGQIMALRNACADEARSNSCVAEQEEFCVSLGELSEAKA